MGWGRMLLLGDFGQQMDIQDQKREIDDARVRLEGQRFVDRSQNEQIAQLAAENQSLRLYVFGLVRLLESKNIFTADDIRKLVDGVEAGETKPEA